MDGCSQSELSTVDYLRRFNAEVVRRRVPLAGGISLSYACNLRCVHCYAEGCSEGTELSTAEVCGLLDQCAEAGCLYLFLTGGEPLLRPDFGDIYRHARGLGIIVSLHTNGTLVDESTIELLLESPPNAVEISLYGATRTTYEEVTGVAGSFDRCMRGIRMIVASGIRLNLKSMILSLNVHEVGAMAQIARDLGCAFRTDPVVFPRFSGDRAPLAFRVDPELAAAVDMPEAKVPEWRALFERQKGLAGTDRLYSCGSGVTTFHIDSAGGLHPCLMARHIGIDLRVRPFIDAWRELVDRMAASRAPAEMKCRDCGLKCLCGYCPAFFELETGSETVYSDYVCKLGYARLGLLSGQLARRTT